MFDINELSIIKKLNRYPWINKILSIFLKKDFMMFLIVGVVNTLNGIWLAYVYSSIIHNANGAFACGYITALLISYLLNSFITFKERLSFLKGVRFCLSYLPNFIIQSVIVYIIYNLMGWHKLIAYSLAAVIGIPVTFLLMKFFAFGQRKQAK